MTRDFTQRWLGFMSLFVIGFGLFVALGAHPSTAGLMAWFADLIFWPLDGAEALAANEARLLAAISGGVMVGWGVMLWLVVTRLLPLDPGLARAMLVWGTLAWFLVDSSGSLAAGAPINVALNTVLMLGIVGPAWRIGQVSLRSAS